MWSRLTTRWRRPVDATGLALFRILFGTTMCLGALRFLWNGWVDRFFVQPDYYFPYWGLEWLTVAPPGAMYAIFVAIAVLAAMVAVGFCYRFAIVGFLALFTYVELIDVTNYLNHYVLVSMIAGVLVFLPAHATWSVDAKLWSRRRSASVPQLAYDWLRFQIGAVWVSASIAKMTPDWLLHAQPLNIWLNARTDTPLIGGVLDVWEVAIAASWAGMLYDLSIPFLLLWKRTRKIAFIALLGFHFMTHVWFTIGMFPLIMVVSATIFLSPDWPRALRQRVRRRDLGTPDETTAKASWSSPRLIAIAIIWCCVLTLLPLRFIAYGGNVLWHEQGMRWGFKVLCREKNGAVTYHVRLPDEDRTVQWSPHTWLTPHQVREMSGQPDMILRLAHDVADDFRRRGHGDVEVYADAIVSLNGRAPAPLIDPDIDLTTVEDGIGRADWILPAPSGPPPRLGRVLLADPPTLTAR